MRGPMSTAETLVPPPPQTAGTFPLLDTMRAIGALCVVLTHVAFWSGDYTRNGAVGTFFARLDVGVAIFFVLSGFLLSRAWITRAQENRPAPRLAPYFWHRFLRIAPIYLVAVLLALTLVQANEGLSAGRRLTTLLMLDTFVHDNFPAGLTQMWSLAVEVSFYVLLPGLMLLLLGRTGTVRPRRVLAGLALMSLVSVWWHLDGAGRVGQGQPLQWLPSYLTWFAGGILLALIESQHARGRSTRASRALAALARQPGSCWALVLSLMLVAATPIAGPTLFTAQTPAESLTKHLLYATVGFLVVLTGVLNDPASRYSRAIGHPAGRRLGWISYGVFCLHLPILHLVMWSTGWQIFAGRGLLIGLLGIGLSVLAAEVGYRVVERPALRLKGRWLGADAGPTAPTITPTRGTSIR